MLLVGSIKLRDRVGFPSGLLTFANATHDVILIWGTPSVRDVVPWQFQDIPPRLVPGLSAYAEVIKKCSNVGDFAPVYTRPRPSRCLIHTSNACKQYHLCLEYASWELEQDYAYRLASIQFEGRDPVDIDGDVVPSSVARYRPAYNPVESAVPRDAALIYQLKPCLLNAQRAASLQGADEEPKATFSFVPADSKTPNARVLLTGNLRPTGSHAGQSPEETGEGPR